MTDGAPDTATGTRVPPKDWIPEKPFDSVEWMDRNAPVYEDGLTAEQKDELAAGDAEAGTEGSAAGSSTAAGETP